MIDLHTHSTSSDGTLSPTELIEEANRLGLKALALTDHDVIDGLEEFQKAAQKYPALTAVNGCELGVKFKTHIEILALNIKDFVPYRERQQKLLEIRHQTNLKRIELLNKIGIPIRYEDVAFDEKGQKRNMVSQPHFAQWLLEKGFIQTEREAYTRFLGKSCPAYVKKDDPDLKETVEFIAQTGAVPVMAHPYLARLEENELFELLKELKSYGLRGIECYHSDQTQEQTRLYLNMARDLGLLVSGGSDYHGMAHPDTHMAVGRGNLHIPDMLLDPILENRLPSPTFYEELLKNLEQNVKPE